MNTLAQIAQGDGAGLVRRYRSTIALYVGAAALLVGMVYAARDSLVVSVVALGVVAMVVLFMTLGLRGTATLLIFAGMALAPLTQLTLIPGVTLVTLADFFFVVGFALLAPGFLVVRASPPPLFLLGAGLVLTTSLIASALATNPGISFSLMFRMVAATIAFPLLFMLWGPDRRTCTRLACGYMLGVAISTGWGLVEGANFDDRYIGLSEHPNVLGLTGLLGAALVPFVVSTVERKHRWLWWGAGAVCLLAVWMSGSRAALAVAVALVLLYPVVERSVAAAVWLIVAACAGVYAFDRMVATEGDNALARLLGEGSASGSDIQRQNAMDIGLNLFWQRPLIGNGYEDALNAHVIYLQVAACIGIFGVLGFLMILWTAIRPLLTASRPFHRIAYPALAYAMIGMATSLLWDRYTWSVVALSFVIASRRWDQGTREGPDRSTPRRPHMLSVADRGATP
jgi:O-antigen ligase/polysaccharide polymerase Wzy-like membrane protein